MTQTEWRCEWCNGGMLQLPVKHQKYCSKQCKKEAIKLRHLNLRPVLKENNEPEVPSTSHS